MSALAPLYGLVLAGGRSSRMHADKAALPYAGEPQLARAMALLGERVARAFVAVRAEQLDEPLRARHACIVDDPRVAGPLAGLLAAQRAHPEAAWLVLACDLPLLDEATLRALITARAPQRPAVAFASAHDSLPEPLCAIYEPGSAAALLAYVTAGGNCPRKFLLRLGIELLALPYPRALDNINEPQEYRAVSAELAAAAGRTAPIDLHVQYFAVLREQAGISEERVRTAARSALQLYEELRARHGFTLREAQLRVAVNAEFSDWSAPLHDGDAVVFIPPVAGG